MNLDRATELAIVEADLLTWMTVHGNLLLSLRHPMNTGASAQIASGFVEKLGKMLVEGGILSQADLDRTLSVEREQRGGH